MNHLLTGVRLVNRRSIQLRKYVTIGDTEAYKQLVESPKKKILYFTASWCPPVSSILYTFDYFSLFYFNILLYYIYSVK